jgi:RNA-binding protein YhbY
MVDRKALKKRVNELRAEFSIGKAGITPGLIEGIGKYLDAHALVKVKVSVAEDKEAMKFYSSEVSSQLHAELMEVKGFTFVLYREKD